MEGTTLIADSGSTKAEWILLHNGKKKTLFTQGLSPYFLSTDQIATIVQEGVREKIKNLIVNNLFFYGTGLRA